MSYFEYGEIDSNGEIKIFGIGEYNIVTGLFDTDGTDSIKPEPIKRDDDQNKK